MRILASFLAVLLMANSSMVFGQGIQFPARQSPKCEMQGAENCFYVMVRENDVPISSLLSPEQYRSFLMENEYSALSYDAVLEARRGYIFWDGPSERFFPEEHDDFASGELHQTSHPDWFLAYSNGEQWVFRSDFACLDIGGGTVCRIFRTGMEFSDDTLPDWYSLEEAVSDHPGIMTFIRSGTATVNIMMEL